LIEAVRAEVARMKISIASIIRVASLKPVSPPD
jgi:hypothetical protein